MPHPRKLSMWLMFLLAATSGLAGIAVAQDGVEVEFESGASALSELGGAWSRLQWVGFASVELSSRTVHGAGGPQGGTHVAWEAAGYGRTPASPMLNRAGGYTITAAFDSRDKSQQELLADKSAFQYPVLGDSSVVHEDAASRGPVYLRVEKGRNYFLYGDWRTDLTGGQYVVWDRQLTGAKFHYETPAADGRFEVTAMASGSRQRTTTEWLPSLGTVGYYRLSQTNIVPGSERVHVTAPGSDADVGPGAGLGGAFVRPLQRDVDYTIDYYEGTILFKEPVPMADAEGNPYVVVVRYEYETDAAASLSGALRLGYESSRWRGGLSYVRDQSGGGLWPERSAVGLDAAASLAPWLRAEVEWASSTAAAGSSATPGSSAVSGSAYRLGFSGDMTPELSYRLGYSRQEPRFTHLHGDGPSGVDLQGTDGQLRWRPALEKPGASLGVTLGHGVQTSTPTAASAPGLTSSRTSVDAVYGLNAWTLRGRVESGHYAQSGSAHDRWTSIGYRLGATYRFAQGHELGGFRNGTAAVSEVTNIEETTGTTGLHYDHRLDDKTRLNTGYSVTDAGRHRLWAGVARRVVDNDSLQTDVYTRYQIDGTINEQRAGTVFGVNNRWQVTTAVAVDFGYERTEGLPAAGGPGSGGAGSGTGGSGGGGSGTGSGSGTGAGSGAGSTPPGTPPGTAPAPTGVREAWNASISFTPDLPYRLSFVYSTNNSGGGVRQHIRLSAVGWLNEDWSVSGAFSISDVPTASGGSGGSGSGAGGSGAGGSGSGSGGGSGSGAAGTWTGRQQQTLGLAYRPIHNSRLNALFAYDRQASGPGTAASSTTQTVSAEASWWATSRLELAGKVAHRHVTSAKAPAPETWTRTNLYQVRGTWAFTSRWDGTLLYRTLQQHAAAYAGTAWQRGWQVSAGFALIESDPRWRLDAGYRYADFAPEDDPSADAFVEGPFVRLTYRF